MAGHLSQDEGVLLMHEAALPMYLLVCLQLYAALVAH